ASSSHEHLQAAHEGLVAAQSVLPLVHVARGELRGDHRLRARPPRGTAAPVAGRSALRRLARAPVPTVGSRIPRGGVRARRVPLLDLVQDHAEDVAAHSAAGRGGRGGRRGGDRGLLGMAVVGRMKRSNKPIFWSLFGAGGMLSALIGPMLIFITGIAVPTGLMPRE